MRILLILLVVAVLSAASRASASTVCASQAAGAAAPPATPDWVVDHYVRSFTGKREWAVMIDCNHPSAPERMQPVSGAVAQREVKFTPARRATAQFGARPESASPVVIRYGSPVVVVSAPNATMTMRLTGVAEGTAPAGRMIRVRLTVFHALVNGIVRDANTVELVGAVQSRWGRQ